MLNKLKIRQRVLFIFLTVALTGSVLQLIVAGLQLQEATYDFHRQQLEISALNLSSSLSDPFEDYVEYNDSEDISDLVRRFQDTDTPDFIVLDQNMSPLFVSSEGSVPANIQEPTDANRIQTTVDVDGIERLYVTSPILYEGQTLGYVITTEPSQYITDDVSGNWSELILGTLMVVILVVMGSFWLANSISTPIQSLEKGALSMAEGYLDTRIDVRSSDEIGQLATSFNYMAEEIDSLVKVQRSFVSNAAHELRTPLMSLSLRVEALQGDNLKPQEKETYLSDLRDELTHMTSLVTSLLNLARIDEGRMQKEAPVEDLSASLKDIARHWRIQAQSKSLSFDIDIPSQLPTIKMSQNHLRLICDNLLGNAVKYTDKGNVRFAVTHDNTQIKITVADTGIGFTEEQGEKLFDRFYRTDIARANFQGTGLGLSIIETLVEDYSGTLSATSKGLNQGAQFVITLPIKKS